MCCPEKLRTFAYASSHEKCFPDFIQVTAVSTISDDLSKNFEVHLKFDFDLGVLAGSESGVQNANFLVLGLLATTRLNAVFLKQFVQKRPALKTWLEKIDSSD